MRKSNITTTTDKKSNKTQAQIFNILDQYYTYKSLNLSQLKVLCNYDFEKIMQNFNYLRNRKYVKIASNHAIIHNLTEDSPIDTTTPIEITVEGKIALNMYKENCRDSQLAKVCAWITLIIAILALAVSIISLVLQWI